MIKSDIRNERIITVNEPIANKLCKYSLLSLVLTIMLFQLPAVSATEPEVRDLAVDVSPNIINIASERNGEIRIATRMPYSFFTGN